MPISQKRFTEIAHEAYREGYRDGLRDCDKPTGQKMRATYGLGEFSKPKPKRKLSAWNKYVKANSNKPRFRLRSGKINLKKMGVAFRKTPAGKKKRR
jgi:hypothetical protein